MRQEVHEPLYGPRRMPDEGLSFDDWFHLAELLAADAVALVFLVPMTSGATGAGD